MGPTARLKVVGCSRKTHKAWLLSPPGVLVQKEWMKSKGLWFAPTRLQELVWTLSVGSPRPGTVGKSCTSEPEPRPPPRPPGGTGEEEQGQGSCGAGIGVGKGNSDREDLYFGDQGAKVGKVQKSCRWQAIFSGCHCLGPVWSWPGTTQRSTQFPSGDLLSVQSLPEPPWTPGTRFSRPSGAGPTRQG